MSRAFSPIADRLSLTQVNSRYWDLSSIAAKNEELCTDTTPIHLGSQICLSATRSTKFTATIDMLVETNRCRGGLKRKSRGQRKTVSMAAPSGLDTPSDWMWTVHRHLQVVRSTPRSGRGGVITHLSGGRPYTGQVQQLCTHHCRTFFAPW